MTQTIKKLKEPSSTLWAFGSVATPFLAWEIFVIFAILHFLWVYHHNSCVSSTKMAYLDILNEKNQYQNRFWTILADFGLRNAKIARAEAENLYKSRPGHVCTSHWGFSWWGIEWFGLFCR
jgi:hypothetical protein